MTCSKSFISALLIAGVFCQGFAQQALYDVTAGNGNGIRFWQSNEYKIHMGNTSEYQFGPVTDYSIKSNMSVGTPGRGWTWGPVGYTPVMALNTQGQMQITGDFTANGKLRTGSGSINSGGDSFLLMYGDRSDDNNYEWTGFYSGTNRQGIILYDGAWSGANNLVDEFSISAENGNKLTLNTQGTDIALMPKGGNVGIGTTTPGGLLEIKGPYTGNSQLIINTTNSAGELRFSDNGTPKGFVWYSQGGNYMAFGRGSGSNSMFVNETGDFGIGTTTPDSKLTVKGTIHTQEVKVDLNGSVAPDYVFENDYRLSSLEELKSYISQNKHLPEIPSAKEMEEYGVNLKEMNLLLLKKVEELTLYNIDLHNELNSEKVRNENQDRALIELKTMIEELKNSKK